MKVCPKCGGDLFYEVQDKEPFDCTELSQKDNEFIAYISCLDCGYEFTPDEVEVINEERSLYGNT